MAPLNARNCELHATPWKQPGFLKFSIRDARELTVRAIIRDPCSN